MPDKTFLETFPLYRKFEIEKKDLEGLLPGDIFQDPPPMAIGQILKALRKPSINVACHECGSQQTFWMHEYQQVSGPIVVAQYWCAGCRRNYRLFFLCFETGTVLRVMKVGQLPPWDISVDQNVAKILGDHLTLYKHGLVCESQGYGIGAHAYYRRIVETIIDQLLAELEGLIGENEREKYQEALEETKKTKVAQHKIALVKDLLPPSLRPEGMNPLALLHDQLSSGLHGETDEQCLEVAEAVRNSLVFLVKNVMQAKSEARKFTDSMKKMLDKKSQKKKPEEE